MVVPDPGAAGVDPRGPHATLDPDLGTADLDPQGLHVRLDPGAAPGGLHRAALEEAGLVYSVAGVAEGVGEAGAGRGGAPRERLPGALAGPGGTRVGGEGDTVPPPPALVSDSRGHAVPDAPAEQPPSRAVAGEGRGGPTAWAGAEGVRVRVNVSADSVLFSFD